MERQSFRGAQAFSPSRSGSPEAAFTFAPGLTLLQDLGGEWAPYMLLSDEPFFFSSGGVGWSTWNEGSLYGTYFSVIFDPRVALRFATNPETTGEEIIDGRTYQIVSTGLDVEAILDGAPPEQPYVDVTLRFPYPEGAHARRLEGLGYEVFGSQSRESGAWEAFKGPYQLSFAERGNRSGQPRSEWNVNVSVIVQGASELESSVEQEIRAALEAYGADPDLLEDARVHPVVQDTHESLRQQWEGIEARLWIDVETSLVRRLAFGSGGEWAIGFWGYGDDIELQVPTDVMDARRVDALERITGSNYDAVVKALQYHETQHGRYPDTLTPETVKDALEALGLTWPTNPFSGAPVRHAPDSAGDFEYTSYGDGFRLRTNGWDLGLGTTWSELAPRTRGEATPEPDLLEQGLDKIRSVDFPVLWLGLEFSPPVQNGVKLSSRALTEAAACPPEPACIWPVHLGYRTGDFGTPELVLLQRSRGESEVPEGEQVQIAGQEATVLIKEEPLPFPGLSGWRATIWLPESVIRVAATVRERDPDWNPFNSEAGLAAAARLLTELE